MTERNRQNSKRKRGLSGMQVFAPWLRETRQWREAQRAADERDRAERRVLAAQASASPLNAMYMAMGHSPDCVARMRRGLIVSCDCATKPVDDPAVALAVALQFEKFARAGKAVFPQSVARLVEAGAAKGDEACRMMFERLCRRGLVKRSTPDGDPRAQAGRRS